MTTLGEWTEQSISSRLPGDNPVLLLFWLITLSDISAIQMMRINIWRDVRLRFNTDIIIIIVPIICRKQNNSAAIAVPAMISFQSLSSVSIAFLVFAPSSFCRCC